MRRLDEERRIKVQTLVELKSNAKTYRGHETRTISVWEASFIQILGVPLWLDFFSKMAHSYPEPLLGLTRLNMLFNPSFRSKLIIRPNANSKK